MFAFAAMVFKFLGGDVAKALLGAYQEHLTATTTDKQTAAGLAGQEIGAQTADVATAAKIVIAEQEHWYTASVRPLMALPFIVFAWKVIVFDKVLGLGTTDPLDPNMWSIFTAVVVAYFGGRSVEKVARILKG